MWPWLLRQKGLQLKLPFVAPAATSGAPIKGSARQLSFASFPLNSHLRTRSLKNLLGESQLTVCAARHLVSTILMSRSSTSTWSDVARTITEEYPNAAKGENAARFDFLDSLKAISCSLKLGWVVIHRVSWGANWILNPRLKEHPELPTLVCIGPQSSLVNILNRVSWFSVTVYMALCWGYSDRSSRVPRLRVLVAQGIWGWICAYVAIAAHLEHHFLHSCPIVFQSKPEKWPWKARVYRGYPEDAPGNCYFKFWVSTLTALQIMNSK